MESPFPGKPNIRRYSILPARAMQDERIGKPEMKVLAVLGMYSNSYGICWPSRITMCRHLGLSHPNQISPVITKLCKWGYIRKLQHKDYPANIKRRSAGRTNRYQILWEGNEPLPKLEQFYAPPPKISKDDQGELIEEHRDKETGIKRDGDQGMRKLAQAFKQGIEQVTGQNRMVEPSLKAAESLYNQGVTPDEVKEYTRSCCKEMMMTGKSIPMTLNQVAKWAGLVL